MSGKSNIRKNSKGNQTSNYQNRNTKSDKGGSYRNRNTNKRGNSGNGKDKTSKVSDSIMRSVERPETVNDISWYVKEPQLLNDAGNISYLNAIGDRVPYGYATIPGIMEYRIHPIIGLSRDGNSAVNIAASKMYSWIRHKNSRTATYDPGDLMIYCLTMDSIYSLIQFGARSYGLCGTYSSTNRYVPKLLLETMGWNTDDLENNMNDLRMYLNMKISEVSAYVVPQEFDLFTRHKWLYEHVFLDANNPKAQMYVFNPDGYYKYNWVGVNHPELPDSGGLTYVRMPREGMLVSDFKEILNDLILRIRKIADYGVMSADILNAYGNDAVWQFQYIAENYAVVPTYNPEVLMQIENARTLPEYCELKQDVVYISDADAHSIIYNPLMYKATDRYSLPPEQRVWEAIIDTFGSHRVKQISMDVANPTPADNMIATRFNYFLELPNFSEEDIAADPDLGTAAYFYTAGTEFITEAIIWEYEFAINYDTKEPEVHVRSYHAESFVKDKESTNTYFKMVSQLEKFDKHHEVWTYDNRPESDIGVGVQPDSCSHMDVVNVGFVDAYVMNNLNSVALMSLYNVPKIGF